MGNYLKKHAFKHDISPLCNLNPLRENNTCLHLLSCCTNTRINNLCTNRHNDALHAIAQTLLAHPTTRYFIFINAGKIKDKPPNNTIPTRLLPCSCYLPTCKCLATLRPYILCLLGTTTTHKSPFLPHSNLKSPNNQIHILQQSISTNRHLKKNKKICHP